MGARSAPEPDTGLLSENPPVKLGSNATADRFQRFGLVLYRRRWAVIAAWAVVILIAVFGAARAPDVLRGSAAGIPNSTSARAQELLRTQFRSPFQYPFIVTVTSPARTLDDPSFRQTVQDLEDAVAGKPFVTRTFGYNDGQRAELRSPDGHRTFLVVGIAAKNFLEAEQSVPLTREALEPVIRRWQATDPGLKVHVTGDIPIGYDGTRALVTDTATAERRILPVALLFLLVAFGALAAAGVPVVVGALATLTTLGLLYVVGQSMNLSSMAQNISSMVGLGVGIDYSLIMVSRFRESLARVQADPTVENPVAEAVAETVATAGQAVLYSGLTVMIAFLALFFPGLIDTTSLAVAGSLTVLVAVALAMTLIPALLGVLGRWVDWPFGVSRWIARFDHQALWYRWARLVMRYPAQFLIAGTLIMLALAAPAFTVKFGQFSSKFLPAGMEAGYGLIEMEKMGQAGQVYPIQVVVRREDGKPILDGPSLRALAGVVREFRRSPVVQDVDSIVQHAGRILLMGNVMYGGDLGALRERFPEGIALMLSENASGTVISVVPRTGASYGEIKDFVRGLQDRDWSQVPGMGGMEVAFAGPAAVNNDFEHAILSNLAKVMGLVFVITFVLLAWSFRSILLPIKALVMNTLSTAASFGALVLVFQHGWFPWITGYPEPVGSILVPIPIIVFCAVFGLSMDYEVFLLSRIQEEYEATGDNERAVAVGLAATGGIITNAAAIMLLVFGAFAMASVVLTKMLGFGLAVAVLLDALIIRVMLVPSFMALAGKWNWWPNIIPHKNRGTAPLPERVGSGR